MQLPHHSKCHQNVLKSSLMSFLDSLNSPGLHIPNCECMAWLLVRPSGPLLACATGCSYSFQPQKEPRTAPKQSPEPTGAVEVLTRSGSWAVSHTTWLGRSWIRPRHGRPARQGHALPSPVARAVPHRHPGDEAISEAYQGQPALCSPLKLLPASRLGSTDISALWAPENARGT